MSKAFTKEDDLELDLDREDELDQPPVPRGKTYITLHGANRMRNELKELRYKTRPEITKIVSWAAGNGDRSENGDYTYNKKRLRDIDRRIRFLSKRLESAEIIDPTQITADHVLIGATVTIRDEEDLERTYSIVGIDEVDLAKHRISWASPLGAALLKTREGDLITFNSPRGAQEIEIVKIEYKEIP
ncbi:MAG: transcription elongation factor GreB [Oligoflexia bacterium]|nr:transcription elongation factor GreB [Oligoflexia bacterium]